MDIDNAIGKHAEWKAKLRLAISKREQLDVAQLSRDDCCELGIWLHGIGKRLYGSDPLHGQCVAQHAAFHVEVASIARKVNAMRYDEAEQMLGAGTAYAHVSSALGVSFLRLRKQAAA